MSRWSVSKSWALLGALPFGGCIISLSSSNFLSWHDKKAPATFVIILRKCSSLIEPKMTTFRVLRSLYNNEMFRGWGRGASCHLITRNLDSGRRIFLMKNNQWHNIWGLKLVWVRENMIGSLHSSYRRQFCGVPVMFLPMSWCQCPPRIIHLPYRKWSSYLLGYCRRSRK